MAKFTGQLNQNEIYRVNVNEAYASLYNTILRHIVFSDNIYDDKSSLMDMATVDGGLYGDQVLYTDIDILGTQEWLGDAEAPNLLDIKRNKTEYTQAIVVDKFRMCWLTTDSYLSKRAWSDENAFGKFTSALLQTINDAKRVHDSSEYNVYIGTTVAENDKAVASIDVTALGENPTQAEVEAYNRLEAQETATVMADLIENLKDYTREYNDLGYLRSYNPEDIVVVWNSEFVNKIRKTDMPTIFHELNIDKFAQHTLTPRFFGTINTTGGNAPATNLAIRSLHEADYTVGTGDTAKKYHVFAGELVPSGAAYAANQTYTEDNTIAFKLLHKESVPRMVAFSTGSEFWNPRSLTKNNYIIWGYNTYQYLLGKPFITGKLVVHS